MTNRIVNNALILRPSRAADIPALGAPWIASWREAVLATTFAVWLRRIEGCPTEPAAAR